MEPSRPGGTLQLNQPETHITARLHASRKLWFAIDERIEAVAHDPHLPGIRHHPMIDPTGGQAIEVGAFELQPTERAIVEIDDRLET